MQYVFSQFIPNDSCFFAIRPLQYVFMIQDKPQVFGLLLSNQCKKFLLSSPNHGFGCSIVTKSVQGVLIHVFRSKRSGKLIFHTISGSLIHTCIRIKHTHKTTTTIWRIMWRKNLLLSYLLISVHTAKPDTKSEWDSTHKISRAHFCTPSSVPNIYKSRQKSLLSLG